MDLLAQSSETTTLVGGGVLGALCGFLTFFLSWLVKEYLPLKRQQKKDDMEEKKNEEARLVAPYIEQIAKLEAVVGKLDARVNALQAEHLECVTKHAALDERVKVLTEEVQRLRQWRHDQANDDHVQNLKNEIARRQQQ